MKVKGVVINDLHFGINDSKRLYDELSLFKDYIMKEENLNLVIIDGDYFDKKLSLGDSASIYAVKFFHELIEIARLKKLKVRMVQGTRSHDLNQLSIFKNTETDTTLDFKIIETVQEEKLCGLDVLYIPEEYPENQAEYYAPYLADGKTYHCIFGHGTWKFQAPPGAYEKSQLDTHSAPVFIEEDWLPHVPNGFISFGHIHKRALYPETTKIKPTTKIFYSGSYTRWDFTDRSERGFTFFEYDLDNQTYKVEFVDNTIAPAFDVINVKALKSINLETSSVEDIISAVNTARGTAENLKINLEGLDETKIALLKKYYEKHYASDPGVRVEVKDTKSRLKESTTTERPEFTKYHYITKREIPLNEMIVRFAKEEMNKDIDIKLVDKIIGGDDGK